MKNRTELESFRAAKDKFYGRDHRAPLTPEQQRGFEGLSYFPENDALVIKARIDRNVQTGIVHMEPTEGEQQDYRRSGVEQFEVGGRPAPVILAASGRSHDLLLPFRGSTSAKKTYVIDRDV